MYVDVYVQTGLRTPRCGWGDVVGFGIGRSCFKLGGSYHVLVMGGINDDYVLRSRILGLPISQFPPGHPYERLAGRFVYAGVTGT